MDRKSIRNHIGAGILFAGLAVGVLAHPAAAANPPVANPDTVYVPSWNMPYTSSLNVLSNDIGSGLTASLFQNGANGTFVLDPGGTFTYTPNPGYIGFDSFRYEVSNADGKSNVATVQLYMDIVAVGNPDTYSTPFDTGLNIIAPGVIANDTDADGMLMGAYLDTSTSHGTLGWGNAGDGSFFYFPDQGFHGTDQFTYLPWDGQFVGFPTTVTITVDPPPNTVPFADYDYYDTFVDTPLTINAPGVLSNDTDAENDLIEVTNVLGPSHGTGAIQPDGTLTYTPNPGFTGDDFISYIPYDGKNYGNQVTAMISVAANHVPVAADDHYTVKLGEDLTISALGVLANDTDADNDALTAFPDIDHTIFGDITINADGSFTYHPFGGPNSSYIGDDTFTYGVFDGTKNGNIATITITILSPDAPTPTGTPDDPTPPPVETPDDKTATPSPTDTPDDETPTPPSGSDGGETATPAPTGTPGDPTSNTPDETKAPETEVGGVISLPDTGAGTSSQASDAPWYTVLAFLSLSGLSVAAWQVWQRATR
jgi:hypothetical protein